ncbi:MAG: glycosyltransferase family 4 protein [Candidatus Goldbacteria bacterium]|nr:glycosyltransferase family 4 protein [Candidatus Goldiibacteriota bacterium]
MKIIIIHDSELIYFEALKTLENQKKIVISVYYFHFIKFLFKGILKLNFKIIKISLKSIFFYIKSFFIKHNIILIGIAPYDWRLIFWMHLLNHNKIIFHNSWPYWNNDDYPEKPIFLKNFIFKSWEKFILNNNTYIINIINKSKEEIIKKYGKDENKIFVIPHCMNDQNYYYMERQKNEKLKILFVGRLVREKGLDILREVIKRLPENDFGIIGDGRDKYILNDVLSAGNVKYYGYINDRKKIGEIMRQYDVFILPSYKTKNWEEVFGIVLIEAMACGLICIATDCIGPLHIIKDMENGFIVKQKNTDMIIEKINFIKNNQEIISKMRFNAIKSVEKYKLNNIINLWQNTLVKIQKGI